MFFLCMSLSPKFTHSHKAQWSDVILLNKQTNKQKLPVLLKLDAPSLKHVLKNPSSIHGFSLSSVRRSFFAVLCGMTV